MNLDRAREYFSAYYEGELNQGLKEAFERKMSADSRLREEYASFASTMDSLSSLSKPVPEPDFDLHERIAARLDRHIWEAEQRSKPGFVQWWKSLALGGIAVVALVAAVFQLKGGGGNIIESNPGLSSSPIGQVTFAVDDSNEMVLRYRSQNQERLDVRSLEGTVLRTEIPGERGISFPLRSDSESAAILQIDIQGKSQAFAVIPGKTPSHRLQGSGTVADFVRAAADHFRVSIAIFDVELTNPLDWNIESTDAFESLRKQLAGVGAVEKRSNGLIVISKD